MAGAVWHSALHAVGRGNQPEKWCGGFTLSGVWQSVPVLSGRGGRNLWGRVIVQTAKAQQGTALSGSQFPDYYGNASGFSGTDYIH